MVSAQSSLTEDRNSSPTPNETNSPSPSSGTQNASTKTEPSISQSTIPTPRSFPNLSPPLIATVDGASPSERATSEETDSLPTLEEMLASTQPNASQAASRPTTSQTLIRVKKEQDLVVNSKELQKRPPAARIRKEKNIEPVVISSRSPTPTPIQQPSRQPKRRRESAATTETTVPPSTKRAKVAKKPKFRKHPTHWLLDGNVILQVKQTGFKLHRSRLAKYSTFFQELFQSEQDAEIIDGHTFYCLDETSITPADFVELLDAMDNAITFYYNEPPFTEVAAVHRASTLLSFPKFREWSVTYLEESWSPFLADLSSDPIHNATESVVLARKFNVPAILKRALYELVRTEGFGQEDSDDFSDEEGTTQRSSTTLSSVDYRILIKARERLNRTWLTTVASSESQHFVCPLSNSSAEPNKENNTGGTSSVQNNPSTATEGTSTTATSSDPASTGSPVPRPSCISGTPRCSQAYTKLVHTSGVFEQFLCDPVMGLQALIEASWEEEGFCSGCARVRREAWGKQREKVWNNLDIWFRLGNTIEL